ncbi:MAG: exodeoxyribonuclease VII small subunit [Gammaproteobacteria bacterium]|nr:exodeoxyribonuclease VII small subunit [Gammaproteobacteria bacterium]
MSDAQTANDQFENALEALEALVRRMESGELSLAQSMDEFERGVALVAQCRKTLDEAEQRIAQLSAPPAEPE